LIRLRGVVRQIVTRARQHLQGFLLRHGRKHGRGTAWRMAYRRWLSTLTNSVANDPKRKYGLGARLFCPVVV
jgi:hypothetical protein